MNLSDMISRRRSVRAYKAEAIAPAVLDDLRAFMAGLVPLIPGAKVAGRIIPTSHGNFTQKWKTPHFIAIFSDGSDDALLNVGFMYQQLDLYAQSLGLGTCWVGLGSLTNDESVPEGMKLAVMMAVGIPDGVPERTLADFRRKSMQELTDRPDDRLEALRLAPSATNSQPWFVTHEGDTLHLYREELGLIKQRTHGRMNKIDMGIGLFHLYAEHPETFRFHREEKAPQVEGQIYVGSVTL
jgi:nitroreductase